MRRLAEINPPKHSISFVTVNFFIINLKNNHLEINILKIDERGTVTVIELLIHLVFIPKVS